MRKCENLAFNESTDNTTVGSLAWIVSYELYGDKAWKTNEIFLFNQIQTGIEIFNAKKCQVTFGFEYIIHVYEYALLILGYLRVYLFVLRIRFRIVVL